MDFVTSTQATVATTHTDIHTNIQHLVGLNPTQSSCKHILSIYNGNIAIVFKYILFGIKSMCNISSKTIPGVTFYKNSFLYVVFG